MPDTKYKIPVRAEYAGNNTVGLSEYQNRDADNNEVISRKFGGTGLDNYDGAVGDILIIGLKADGSVDEDSYKPFTLSEGQILIGAPAGQEIKSGKLYPNEETPAEDKQGFYFDHSVNELVDGMPVFKTDNDLGVDADVTFRSLHLTAPITQDPVVRDGYGLIVDGNAIIKGNLNFTGEGTAVFDSTSVAISDFNLLLGVDGGLSNLPITASNGSLLVGELYTDNTPKHQDVLDVLTSINGKWVLVTDITDPGNDQSSIEETAFLVSAVNIDGANSTLTLDSFPASITSARISLAPIQYTTTDGAGIIIPAMDSDNGSVYKPITFTYDAGDDINNGKFVSSRILQAEDTLLVNSSASTVSVNAAGTILSSATLTIDAKSNGNPNQIVLSNDGAIALTGDTGITGATTITGDTGITGATTIDGTTIDLTGATGITGATTITGNTGITGAVDIDGTTTISGNVGIGTDENGPQRSLHVVGNYIRTDEPTNPTILLRETTNDREWGVRGLTDKLVFMDHGTSSTHMVIDTDGKVGIGTTDPQSKLHVDESNGGVLTLTRTSGSTTGDLGYLRFGNTNIDSEMGGIKMVQDGANNSSRIEFLTQESGGASASKMIIKSDGKVGIGTLPIVESTDLEGNDIYYGVSVGGTLKVVSSIDASSLSVSGAISGDSLDVNDITVGDIGGSSLALTGNIDIDGDFVAASGGESISINSSEGKITTTGNIVLGSGSTITIGSETINESQLTTIIDNTTGNDAQELLSTSSPTFAGITLADNSITNDELVNDSLTITAGYGLKDGGSVSLGGDITLNVKYDNSTITSTANDGIYVKSGGITPTHLDRTYLEPGDEDSGVISISTGGGLTGGPISGSGTISHDNTSNQASSNNSGRTYIQDVTLDEYGHVTGLGIASETVTDTTYSVGDGGLTEKNFTGTLKSKLDGIATGAEVNVKPNWNADENAANGIIDKPNVYYTSAIPSASASNDGLATQTQIAKLNGIAAGATNVTDNNQIGNSSGYITNSAITALIGDASDGGDTLGELEDRIETIEGSGYLTDVSGASVNYANTAGSAGSATTATNLIDSGGTARNYSHWATAQNITDVYSTLAPKASPTFTGTVTVSAIQLADGSPIGGGGGMPEGGQPGQILVADANGDAVWTDAFDCGEL